jgi:hypothetical protein
MDPQRIKQAIADADQWDRPGRDVKATAGVHRSGGFIGQVRGHWVHRQEARP